MEHHIKDIVTEIKKELRLSMNGVISALQRKQGLNYKINFGVEIPRIKSIASAHEKNRELAKTLWNENIRECKLLAIFLMPENEFTATDANEWIASVQFTEIADNLAMYLLCKIPNAAENALKWLEEKRGMFCYCGCLTLSHLFRNGCIIPEEKEHRFLNTIGDILDESNGNGKTIRLCAHTTLMKYVDSNPKHNTVKASQHPKVKHFFI